MRGCKDPSIAFLSLQDVSRVNSLCLVACLYLYLDQYYTLHYHIQTYSYNMTIRNIDQDYLYSYLKLYWLL